METSRESGTRPVRLVTGTWTATLPPPKNLHITGLIVDKFSKLPVHAALDSVASGSQCGSLIRLGTFMHVGIPVG